MKNYSAQITAMSKLLDHEQHLELAILIGSRATGTAQPGSDWDLAVQWSRSLDNMSKLGKTETLRRQIAKLLDREESAIDLIDLPAARLTMRAVVAEEGIVLKGDGSLAWNHFLQRTWRDLEEYYWEQTYAA